MFTKKALKDDCWDKNDVRVKGGTIHMEDKVESIRNEMPDTIDNMPKKNHKNNKRKKQKGGKRKKKRKIILIIIAVIVLFLAFFLFDVLRRTNNAFNEMFQPLESASIREEQMNLGEDPFSVLILGLDEGRTDSMMIATVNPNLGSTYLLSIARDTMVDIPGFGTTRINHAYSYGGIDLCVNTVQDFLNVPIDYYVSLNMEEFPALVDAFGGLTLYNDTVAFSLGGYDFPLGEVRLTGSAAYYYVRMRHEDPNGDFGRQERQRDILEAMAGELVGITVVSRYQQILDSVGDNMRTNVSLNEMMSMSINYTTALRNITNLDLRAPGEIIGGMYLIPIPEDQRLEMSTTLRNHLELD